MPKLKKRLNTWLLLFSLSAVSIPADSQSTTASRDAVTTTTELPHQTSSSQAEQRNLGWQVKLRSFGALRGSGVLLDRSWALTAASCFNNGFKRPSSYSVYFNSADDVSTDNPFSSSSPQVKTSYVESYYLHGRYVVGSSHHNIALIQLHNNVSTRHVPADVIEANSDVNSDSCFSLISDSKDEDGSGGSHVVSWRVLNSTQCARLHGLQLPDDQLCALPESNTTVLCSGDVGSAVLCGGEGAWRVTGLVSQPWRCGLNLVSHQEPQLAVLLNVQYYLPFVEKRGHFKGLPVV